MEIGRITVGFVITKAEGVESYGLDIPISFPADENSLVLVYTDDMMPGIQYINLTNFLTNLTNETLKKKSYQNLLNFLSKNHNYLLISAGLENITKTFETEKEI